MNLMLPNEVISIGAPDLGVKFRFRNIHKTFMSKVATPRPRFEPVPCGNQHYPALQSILHQWQPIVNCPAGFPVELVTISF